MSTPSTPSTQPRPSSRTPWQKFNRLWNPWGLFSLFNSKPLDHSNLRAPVMGQTDLPEASALSVKVSWDRPSQPEGRRLPRRLSGEYEHFGSLRLHHSFEGFGIRDGREQDNHAHAGRYADAIFAGDTAEYNRAASEQSVATSPTAVALALSCTHFPDKRRNDERFHIPEAASTGLVDIPPRPDQMNGGFSLGGSLPRGSEMSVVEDPASSVDVAHSLVNMADDFVDEVPAAEWSGQGEGVKPSMVLQANAKREEPLDLYADFDAIHDMENVVKPDSVRINSDLFCDFLNCFLPKAKATSKRGRDTEGLTSVPWRVWRGSHGLKAMEHSVI